jgi:hypothetical protein
MPPRWVSAAILAGWIASAIWLFRVELWPSLEPGAPPPFTIDLVEEAQTAKLPIRWRVTQNGKSSLIARTSVEHRVKENDFTLLAVFEPRRIPDEDRNIEDEGGEKKKQAPPPYTISRMSSEYRVTPEGQLLGLEIEMDFIPRTAPLEFKVRVWGEVHDGQFAPHYELKSPRQLSFSPPPVRVSSQGSVVMPLHPVNRIVGLKTGQEWRVPMFDPIADSMASMSGGEGGVHFLKAKVRPQIEILRWSGGDVRCLVIDYHEENEFKEDHLSAETWVREADGLVVKQVAYVSGSRWEMVRE